MSQMFPLKMSEVTVCRGGKTLLGPINFTLTDDGPTIILGPNGSGKTTLLRVMHGIERISSGAALWMREDQARQAYVFQTPIVLRRSVVENLRYPMTLVGTPHPEIHEAVDHWVARIGLNDVRDTPATRLSGGERQKLAIARALIRKPEVLFLDEPCANLDGHATREIEELLQETVAKGTAIVMATHDLGQARRLARNVIFMVGGQIVETGPAPDIFDAPDFPDLRAFLRGDIVI